MKENKSPTKKTFSTASLFFICVLATFTFEYFYSILDKTFSSNPLLAVVILVSEAIFVFFYLYLKFPLFVRDKNEGLGTESYDNTYSKEIKFWSSLFIGFFYHVKINNLTSLFSGSKLTLGVKGRDCKFAYGANVPKPRDRVCDIILTVICSVAVFFLARSCTRFGVIFGIVVFTCVILYVNKKVILNQIFSINVKEDKDFTLRVIYPHIVFDGIFCNTYGFAHYFNNNILIHKDVFSGGENLRRYIIAHEEGHIKAANRRKNYWLVSLFVLMTFFGLCGSGLLTEIGIENDFIVLMPPILYLIFLCFYTPMVRRENRKNEFLADTYAIKKIGKEAVLSGLEIVKSNDLYRIAGIKPSGIPIDRRLEFIKEYQE